MTNVPGVMHKMQEIICGAASFITFSNLNINLDKIYVIHCVIKNADAAPHNMRILINGDSTVTNYHSQRYTVAAGVIAAVPVANDPVFTDIAAAGGNDGCYSVINVMLDIRGNARIMANSCDNIAANVKVDNAAITYNIVQANITSITIQIASPTSIVGSQFILLRLNRYG